MSGHPHAGGEISAITSMFAFQAGPSPRGWGNRDRKNPSTGGGRAIPTRVGKSAHARNMSASRTGHPHAGGEIEKWETVRGVNIGPSPRGWGNRRDCARYDRPTRAIPTRVGKSVIPPMLGLVQAGHPHAGGEIRLCHCTAGKSCGPSPRGWGNQPACCCRLKDSRAIPTRVGKSCHPRQRTRRRAGHPHAGGEIAKVSRFEGYGSGPSPRGWGNLMGRLAAVGRKRAIPTRVGKSMTPGPVSISASGHPHAGGEISHWFTRRSCRYGPSPRGWGNPPGIILGIAAARAIPTRVGKSATARTERSVRAGHPHAGGEIPGNSPHPQRRNGPSPRGWGNRLGAGNKNGIERAIPTRVGKSLRKLGS